MPVERKSLYSYYAPLYWPAWIALGLLRVICWLPHRLGLGIGKLIGRVAHAFAAERRAVVRRNIELCFPELTRDEQGRLARRHFEALGMSVIEMGLGRWASDEKLMALCRIDGLENLAAPQREGKGVILLSAHFTTLEVSGRAIRISGTVFDAVYRRNRSEFVTEFLRSGRERSATATIEKRDIKAMVRRLRDGIAVWYAPDQSYRRKGATVVPFFGVPTMHTTATTTLARLGNAVVVPFFPERTADGHYRLKILPALSDVPSDDPAADVRRYVAVLEENIRCCPEQYFWVHRKFKNLPEGYPDFYADLDAAK